MNNNITNLWPTTILIVLCAAILNFILADHNLQLLIEKGLHLNGIPMPCNNDSYYFFDQAYSLTETGAGLTDLFTDPRQSILLPYLLSFIAGTDKLLMLNIGSYAGPILGLSMLLAVLPWGTQSRSSAVMIISSFLALCAPYWITRTQVGFLDTDSLVPGLCYVALFCVFKISSLKSKITGWVIAYVITTFFLWFWWRPGAILSMSFITLYLVYPKRNYVDTYIKCILLAFVLIVCGLAIAGNNPFAQYATYISAHVELAFGGLDGSLISDSILELKRISPWELCRKSFVFPFLIFPAIYGLITYVRNLRAKALFLGAAFFTGGAACISQRFIPLFIPAASFFAAYGFVALCTFISERGHNLISQLCKKRNYFLITCSACILLFSIFSAYSRTPDSYFSPEDFILAKLIRKNTSADSLIWTWWDYGYFFKFLTDREILFDGGSQSKTTCFLAAYPLMQKDIGIACSWMNYFSIGSIRDKESFIRKNNIKKILRNVLDGKKKRQEATSKPVLLCLPKRVFTTTGYLYSFAHIHDKKIPPIHNHLDLFSKKNFSYDSIAQTVQVPEEMISKGYNSFGTVIDASGTAVEDINFDSLADPYLIYSNKNDYIAVTDRLIVDSVLFRLLGFFENENEYFSRMFFKYDFGGLWLVNHQQ